LSLDCEVCRDNSPAWFVGFHSVFAARRLNWYHGPILRLFLLLGIATSALASVTLEALDSAAQSFSLAIDQQWTIAQSDPSSATLAESTLSYASTEGDA
jgi:hypothetical protein